jgi:hypothetical protein
MSRNVLLLLYYFLNAKTKKTSFLVPKKRLLPDKGCLDKIDESSLELGVGLASCPMPGHGGW